MFWIILICVLLFFAYIHEVTSSSGPMPKEKPFDKSDGDRVSQAKLAEIRQRLISEKPDFSECQGGDVEPQPIRAQGAPQKNEGKLENSNFENFQETAVTRKVVFSGNNAVDRHVKTQPFPPVTAGKENTSDLARGLMGFGVNSLWHMTHINNVRSIINQGLFSHDSPRLEGVRPVDISDHNVQSWRTRCEPFYGLPLHRYVPLYINPRNPMLYRRKDIQRKICFLEISLCAADDQLYIFSDGNAASPRSLFYNSAEFLPSLPWDVLRAKYWNDHQDGKRKACAEVLIPEFIAPHYILSVHCFSANEAAYLSQQGISSVISIDKYFR